MKRTVLQAVLWLAVGSGAFALRTWQLERRPLHHDEANQAVRCGILQEGGGYRYDPAEHHGPTLYYLTLPLAWLTAGRSFANTTATTFRLVPVCFGVAALLLFAGLRRGVGRDGALLAAALGAV